MLPRYSLSHVFYDIKKGSSWPNYDKFLDMALEDIVPENIRTEIKNIIDNDPKYHKSLLPLVKHHFSGLETITEHYSQSWQDLFVLTMLNGKQNGTYLEIGANNPVYINNTYLLEQFGYSGISIDIIEDKNWRSTRKKSEYIVADATAIDYTDILKNMPNQIDYLQLDIDPEQATFDVLKKLPHNQHRFSVITYETDAFHGDIELRDKSRKLLTSLGYEPVIYNVGVKDYGSGQWVPFEDWYVDPLVVDRTIIEKFKKIDAELNLPHEIFIKEKQI